jgi:superfamily I DNA/RNA helicase
MVVIPNPKGKQKDIADLPFSGAPVLVTGPAGSGKSITSVMRIFRIYQRRNTSDEKMIVLTYNKALKKYLETYLRSVNGKLLAKCENYDSFIFKRLNSSISKEQSPKWLNDQSTLIGKIALRTDAKYLLSEQIAIISEKFKEDFLINDIENVYLKLQEFYFNLTSECYVLFPGNGELLQALEKLQIKHLKSQSNEYKSILSVYKQYINRRAEKGFEKDFYELEVDFYRWSQSKLLKDKYDQIIIDEAQDVSKFVLNAFKNLLGDHGRILLFYDTDQKIYLKENPVVKSDFNLGHSIEFVLDENFRNSVFISKFMEKILQNPEYPHEGNYLKAQTVRNEGTLPKVHIFKSKNPTDDLYIDLKWVLKEAVRRMKHESVAILLRNHKLIGIAKNILEKDLGLNPRLRIITGSMDNWNDSPSLNIGTYHSAKGLEFDTVYLPFLGSDQIGSFEDNAGLFNIGLSEELRLFYVAVSRARNNLILTCKGTPSPIVPALDDTIVELQLHESEISE